MPAEPCASGDPVSVDLVAIAGATGGAIGLVAASPLVGKDGLGAAIDVGSIGAVRATKSGLSKRESVPARDAKTVSPADFARFDECVFCVCSGPIPPTFLCKKFMARSGSALSVRAGMFGLGDVGSARLCPRG